MSAATQSDTNIRSLLLDIPAFRAGYNAARAGAAPLNPYLNDPEGAYMWALGIGLARTETGGDASPFFTSDFEVAVTRDVEAAASIDRGMAPDEQRKHLARVAELAAICYGFGRVAS